MVHKTHPFVSDVYFFIQYSVKRIPRVKTGLAFKGVLLIVTIHLSLKINTEKLVECTHIHYFLVIIHICNNS